MSTLDEATIAAHLAEIEVFLNSRFTSVRVLTPGELARYRDRLPIHGWRIGATHHVPDVDLLILTGFPYKLPRVALVVFDRDMPHTEHDGVLCIEQEGTTFNHRLPIYVVEYELARAATLLAELQAGQHNDDFTRDFERYWHHYAHKSEVLVLSLLETIPAVRQVRAARTGNLVVVAQQVERATQWIRNRYGSDAAPDQTVGILCPLPEVPKPNEYPNDGDALLSYLDRVCPEGAQELCRIANSWPKNVLIVFCIDRPPRPAALGAIYLSAAMKRSTGKKQHKLAKGKPGDLASQWMAAVTLERLPVQRAEAAWVHGRYTDVSHPILSKKSVVVVGTGSLGAGVAQLLAQSGIGELALVDPDVFELANSSRHILGADSLRLNKAHATASMIRRRLPHHQGVAGYPSSWQQLFSDKPDVLSKVDLVLSLTGDWNADAELSDLQHSGMPMPPIIFGWVEPYACAAHAVLLKANSACLRCHFSETGVADRRVTEWPDNIETVHVCGAVHTPFGAAALGFAQAMLASMALDTLLGNSEGGDWRVWTSTEAEISAHGGAVSARWVDVFGKLTDEPRIQRLSWSKSDLCRACRVAAST